MKETFKTVTGYEDKYEISNYGNVKSTINRYTSIGTFIMKQDTRKNGYKTVELSQPSKRFLIHRLVASHFLENPDNLPVVNHKDNTRDNNLYSNLEWTTQSENMLHAQKQGRLTTAQSTGGKVNGKLQRENSKQAALLTVGRKYNNWTVLSYEGTKIIKTTTQRDFVKAQCKCGYISDHYYLYLTKGNTTQCNTCGKLEASKKRVDELLTRNLNKQLGDWKLTSNYTFEGFNVRLTKFEVTCTTCNSISEIPYQSLSGIKPIKKCKTCKQR